MPDKNLSSVFKHIEIINEEMGAVKRDVAVLKNDCDWIKMELEKQSKRQWYIVAGIMVSVILALSNIIGGV